MPENICNHSRKIGDNYGESCMDCGQQLSGYGYGGWFGANMTGRETCIHLWTPVSKTERICVYCEKWEGVQP